MISGVRMITSIVVGNRSNEVVISRYYGGDHSTPQEEKMWENELLALTAGTWGDALEGNEEVGAIRDYTVVWCSVGDVWVFVSGKEDHSELVLVEVLRGFLGLLRGVCKDTPDERSIVVNNHKIRIYLSELVTPRGHVQTLDYNRMRTMVKMDL